MDNGKETLIRLQFDELVKTHSRLVLSEDLPGRWVVRGDLSFNVTYENITIEDAFSLLISLPRDYPQSPPTVQETGGRIPRDINHHVLPRTGNLCLGAPLGVRLEFRENPTLLHFVNELVVPFLFSFSYKERYGEMPYGELSHGYRGIFEYYQDLFGIKSQQAVLGLLKMLAEECYRGHLPCPCGSGKRFRHCHRELLRKIGTHQNQDEFLRDYLQCLTYLQESEQSLDKSLQPSKKAMKRLKKLAEGFDENIKRGADSMNHARIT